jgi:hypothetical protein
MRKTFALLLATAFVATLPTLASAKSKRHHRHHREVVTQPFFPDNAGPRFVFSAIHQIFVPLEVTLGPRTY